MHEFGIAENILKTLGEIKIREGVENIIKVKLKAGAFLHIVPETLKFAFETIALDTEFKNTVFELMIEPVMLKCNKCGHADSPEKDNYICSGCNSDDVKLVGSKEFIIESIEV